MRGASWFLALALLSGAAEARDPSQVRAFRKANPCPATGQVQGACPGWVVDHIIPLCGGGADHPSNMQWQRYRESKKKDKVEIAFCACLRRGSACPRPKFH